MSQIKIANLQKSFGDFTAVKNSNLTIKDKEFLFCLVLLDVEKPQLLE